MDRTKELIRKAFEIMIKEKHILLSEAGRKFLDQPIQHPPSKGNFGDSWQEEADLTEKAKNWRIESVSHYGTLTIETIDKYGLVDGTISNCPLNYFIIEEVKKCKKA